MADKILKKEQLKEQYKELPKEQTKNHILLIKEPSYNSIKDIVGKWGSTRLDWNNYFMSITYLVSSRSPSKKLKVGATIVKNKRIISSGYNGFLSSIPHISISRNGHEENTIHAEQNAIGDCAKRGISTKDASLFITHFPCINCSKYIVSSGIKEVIYSEDYHNDELVNSIMLHAGIKLFKLK